MKKATVDLNPTKKYKVRYCPECKAAGKMRVPTMREVTGRYSSYCRKHRLTYMAKYMAKRRVTEPKYGQLKKKEQK